MLKLLGRLTETLDCVAATAAVNFVVHLLSSEWFGRSHLVYWCLVAQLFAVLKSFQCLAADLAAIRVFFVVLLL